MREGMDKAGQPLLISTEKKYEEGSSDEHVNLFECLQCGYSFSKNRKEVFRV